MGIIPFHMYACLFKSLPLISCLVFPPKLWRSHSLVTIRSCIFFSHNPFTHSLLSAPAPPSFLPSLESSLKPHTPHSATHYHPLPSLLTLLSDPPRSRPPLLLHPAPRSNNALQNLPHTSPLPLLPSPLNRQFRLGPRHRRAAPLLTFALPPSLHIPALALLVGRALPSCGCNLEAHNKVLHTLPHSSDYFRRRHRPPPRRAGRYHLLHGL